MNLNSVDEEPLKLNEDNEEVEPLKLYEAVGATAIVVFALASIAVCFASLVTCQYASDTLKRFRRKGGQHVS